ncbi:MAG TPA: GTP 3',8-cyclase MoaA [Chitinophagaceae bacterium]|nr:GTP 3',8-cyclase MoaA [Chitinophagaceae bacterium]
MLYDTHHRVHNYLRISLTDACNFRCFYCMPNEEVDVTPNSKLMSKEEIFEIAKIFVSLGVNKIRLTGGEPLVRKDIGEIIELLSSLPVKLTMTTNGVLVHKYIDIFKKANLKSINISLDPLNPITFLSLTKRDQFYQVKKNIDLLLKHHFSVKVNVVTMKGINDKEITDFVEWTQFEPIHVRFIEFMPFANNQWMSDKVFTYQQILSQIAEKFDFVKIQDELNDTTKKYQVYNHQGTFAIISTMTAPFCATCNRLRLTADGKLKNCLFSKGETDLLTLYRNHEDIIPSITQTIKEKEKALGGQLFSDFTQIDTTQVINRSMISIGG